MVDGDLEIGDVESFRSSKDSSFSFSTLIMMAYQKCLNAGCNEMVAGFYAMQENRKNGTITRTYQPDTRKVFIESVTTLKMLLVCQFYYDAEKNIKKLLEDFEMEKNKLIEQRQKEWDSLTKPEKEMYVRKNNYQHIVGRLNIETDRAYIIEKEVIVYRLVFEELNQLVKRLDFFESDYAEG